jgi:NDP-sugar pyrophosphorylase family protein
MVLQAQGHKAMIMAAGLGTRLMPMTEKKPKALVEWKGVPLLEHVILKLKSDGFTRIIINVHHHSEMIMEYVSSRKQFGIQIEFSHEIEELLDTGGGIANASWFLKDEPFLVYNVDVNSSIDLDALYRALAVKERVTSRSLLMNREGFLKGWRDNRSGETILVDQEEKLYPIAFSATQVLNPEIFSLFPAEKCFPLMPFYLELARTHPVYLHRHDRDTWTDMGKLESYA